MNRERTRFGLTMTTSLLAKGEVWTLPARVKPPHTYRGSVQKRCGGALGGWRQNGGKVATVNQGALRGTETAFMLDREPKNRRAGVRVSIVAKKCRNGHGAKGHRKVKR